MLFTTDRALLLTAFLAACSFQASAQPINYAAQTSEAAEDSSLTRRHIFSSLSSMFGRSPPSLMTPALKVGGGGAAHVKPVKVVPVKPRTNFALPALQRTAALPVKPVKPAHSVRSNRSQFAPSQYRW